MKYKSNPLASRFARAGVLSQAQGEVELQVKVRPPEEPGTVEATCKLSLTYGNVALSLDLPIHVRFIERSLDLSPPSVIFSAATQAGLNGQTRTVQVAIGVPGQRLTLHDVPSWLEGEVLNQSEAAAEVRLRVKSPPPESLALQTIQVGHGPGGRLRVPLRVSAFAPKR